MRRSVVWILLSLFALGCQGELSSGDGVLEPVRVEGDGSQVNGDPATAALRFIADHRGAFAGLSADDDFSVHSLRRARDGLTHVRVRQQHRGVRVWGAALVVHLGESSVRFLNGNYAKGLDRLDVAPLLEGAQALELAFSHYASRAKDQAGLDRSREAAELVVTTMAGDGPRLAWHVEFFTELQAGLSPGLWNYFIDAHGGDILFVFNGIDTLAQASGPGGNPNVIHDWVEELDVEPSGSAWVMDTARLYTSDMNNSTYGSGTLVTGPLDNIGDAAINDAHGYAEQTLNMLGEWMGYNSIDDNGFVIRSRVHYGTNYENAFWDGSQMTYGDGDTTFYPLSGAIDVVSHEINHGFTTFHSDLTYSGMSGGLNEAFSDVAGKMAEFYWKGDNTGWDIGRDIFQGDSALRFMCDPPQDGSSIGHASDYTSGMDVHYSSGVMNKAFCRAAKRFASGDPDGQATVASVRRVGHAVYLANEAYWTASTNFTQGCQGVMDAAVALGFSGAERDHLRDSWADVGVYCDGAVEPIECDTTFTGESGTLTSPNYPSSYPNNYNHTWCIQPASGDAATLTFTAFDTESNYDFVRVRDPNGELSYTSGTTAPPPATATLIAVTFTSDGSVTRTGFSADWTTGGSTNQPPTVSSTSPAAGATVSGVVTIAASASDSDGTVAKVTLTLPGGGTVDLTSTPYTYEWDSTTVANGNATILAVAEDDDGASSAEASVTVTVNNGTSDCVDGEFTATDVPISIPDNDATGITSTLGVAGDGVVQSLAVSVNITHTYEGDLRVTLVSPTGARAVLHDRTGGSANDVIIVDRVVTEFDGATAAGNWQLEVVDFARYDLGTLNGWSVGIVADCSGGGGGGDWSGSAAPNMPTVDNGSACTDLTVSGTGDAADVLLDLAGTHAWRSILRGTLEHNGVVQEAFPTGTFPSRSGSFSLTDRPVPGFAGDAAGTWTLCIIDTDGYNDTGVLETWSVHN